MVILTNKLQKTSEINANDTLFFVLDLFVSVCLYNYLNIKFAIGILMMTVSVLRCLGAKQSVGNGEKKFLIWFIILWIGIFLNGFFVTKYSFGWKTQLIYLMPHFSVMIYYSVGYTRNQMLKIFCKSCEIACWLCIVYITIAEAGNFMTSRYRIGSKVANPNSIAMAFLMFFSVLLYEWMYENKIHSLQLILTLLFILLSGSKKGVIGILLKWLKLYNRIPQYTVMVDKYRVREYIAERLGEQYLIPLLGVWNDPKEIDFDKLPNQFVLKCNHNSGLGMCICKDKSKLDVKKVKAKLKNGLKQNYYLVGREWPYKDVAKKIICEKYMTDYDGTNEFTDYKFFCFNGKVDCVMVCTERSTGNPKFFFFDNEWNLCRYNVRGKSAPKAFTVPKPGNVNEMFAIAAKLSENIPFSRIDLYNSNGQIYFGEITFFPDSGFDFNILPETDIYFGNLIDLESVK